MNTPHDLDNPLVRPCPECKTPMDLMREPPRLVGRLDTDRRDVNMAPSYLKCPNCGNEIHL